jgi:hypothetical protein
VRKETAANPKYAKKLEKWDESKDHMYKKKKGFLQIEEENPQS